MLYTSSLRRLAEVTQVVAADVGHVFHNRLTHSLQVAQVGRRLAERLVARDPRSNDPSYSDGLDPDVVEAAGLAHDLGHPPFGHIAEEELNNLAGDAIGGFEGNAQSFRIVTRLSQHSPRYRGLDLTRATLAAILKYPWLKGGNPNKPHKWGAYPSETKDFEFATMTSGGSPMKPKTLEAKLMDWSDDITYSVHDVEDFYRAGRVPLHLLADRRYLKERRRFLDAAFARHPHGEGWTDHSELEEAFTGLISLFPLEGPYTGTWRERASLRDFTSQLINRFVNGTRLSLADNRCVLDLDPNIEMEVSMLKELTWVYVIEAPSLATQQAGQRRVIKGLHQLYTEALAEDRMYVFPPYYREALGDAVDEGASKRVVIDLIAGMTEAQALAVHARLSGHEVGSGLYDLV